ncbi:MAG: radical SAM protein [Nitrospinaceae bacterium]
MRVLLVYPNTSEVAQANLGFQRVYSLLNRIPGVICDRLSLPVGWTPGAARPAASSLRSVDLDQPPDAFDMIAFSISFEPDYLNTVTLLDYFNLPLPRAARGKRHPLVVAGGSALFINPEPLAEILDLCFLGEAEGLAERFFHLFTHADWDHPRDLLREAAKIPGIYVPGFYHPEYDGERPVGLRPEPGLPARVVRHWVEEGSPDLCTHSVLHEENSAFKDMALMEVTRGCIWACRFCTAGFIYRPPREPDLTATYESLAGVLQSQGKAARTIGLVGPSVTDHPQLLPMIRHLVKEGKTLSFSSLRMETLTPEVVDLILASGQKTLTVAVDAPSERMRDVINKPAADAFIIDKCRFLIERGVLHLKIYSIIGLPWEEDEDLEAFIHLVESIQKVYVETSRSRGRIGQVTISLNPLVPKPGTPFQFHPMESTSSLKKKFMKLRRALGRLPNLKLSFGSPREAYLQTYLSRGDRRALSFFQA